MKCKLLVVLVIFVGLISFPVPHVTAQSGCCSHHGGVCGCSAGGSKTCCDGTLSPSCTCAPPSPLTTKTQDRIDNALSTITGKSWCGAGDMFTTESAAKKSLTDYCGKWTKPLDDQVSSLKFKVWLNIVFGLFMMFLVYNKEKGWAETILGWIVIIIIFGGFLFFIPS